MFDRLPTPFGLVRAGVAPDHPKIKYVIRLYEKTAASEGFRFFGNVEVGRDVSAGRARRALPRRDLRLRQPRPTASSGSPARTCPAPRGHRVRRLVQRPPRLRRPRVRPLLRAGRRDRQRQRRRRRRPDARPHPRGARGRPTPPTTRSSPLAESGVSEIVVLGRRGPAQAAFTNPEVRELGEMVDADIDHRPRRGASSTSISREFLESDEADMTARKNVEIFTDFSAARAARASAQRIVLRFLRSPVEIQGDGKVERIVVGRNELRPRRHRRAARPRHRRARGDRVRARAALDRLQGIGLEGIPFDERRGVIPQRGRARRSTTTATRSPATTSSAGSSAAPAA